MPRHNLARRLRTSQRVRRVPRWLGAAAVVSLLAQLPFALAAPSPAVAAEAACVSEATTESGALAEAARCGTRVAVTSKRSEVAEVFAEPDGGMSTEITSVPSRVHRADGSWVAVDTTLGQRADGSWAPNAAVVDVRFSGGGTGPLVRFTSGSSQLSYSWPSSLPTPAVSGDSAVYAEVYPGVDLRVKALADGFRYFVVVKTAAAATNPALQAIQLNLSAAGLTVVPSTTGGFEAVDASGAPVLRSGGAAMWDASGLSSPSSATERSLVASAADETADAPAAVDIVELVSEVPDGSNVADAAVAVTSTTLTVTPDQGLMTDPATVFPVVIDPTATRAAFTWGYADSTNANRDDGVARVGNDPQGSGIYRSYFFFDSGSTIGTSTAATVTGANFSITMTHSYSCDSTPVNAYSVGSFSTGRNAWSGPAIQTDGWLGERQGHAHKPSTGEGCSDDPQDDMTLVWDDAYVKNRVQYSHDQGWSSFAVGLMARKSDGSGEGTTSWWKKFDPATASLYIAWNRKPTPPTNVKVMAANTTDCNGTAVSLTNDSTPQLCATPHDADGGTNSVYFEIWSADYATRIQAPPAVTNRTVETPAPLILPTALADGSYVVKAYSCDANSCSDPSGWGVFTVDTAAPALPQIAAVTGGTATYYAKSTGTWSGGLGVPGNFTFTTSAEATTLTVTLNSNVNVPTTNWSQANGVWTGSIAPTKDGVNMLHAVAKDAAGNQIDATTNDFYFMVTPAAEKSWTWQFDGNLNSLDSDNSTANTYPLWGFTPTYVAGATSPSQAVQFNGTSQALYASGPVIDTKSSFTVVARVRLANLTPTGPMTIISQDGGTASGFRLQYRTDLDLNNSGTVDAADRGFCFTMFYSEGAADTTSPRACWNAATVTTSEWVTLAGVYDAGAHVVQLYSYDTQARLLQQTSFTSYWAATASLAVGRARQGGTPAQFFQGDVDRVVVINKAYNQGELTTEMGKA